MARIASCERSIVLGFDALALASADAALMAGIKTMLLPAVAVLALVQHVGEVKQGARSVIHRDTPHARQQGLLPASCS